MLKKLFFIFISLFLLVSCVNLSMNSAYNNATKKDYNNAIKILDKEIRKNYKNKNLVASYQEIFNEGQEYYKATNDKEKLFLLEETYLSLPNEIKNILSKIKIDRAKHSNNGATLAKDKLTTIENIPETNYRNRVRKYASYKDLLRYNPNLKNNIEAKRNKLYPSIEKTFNIKVINDGNFNYEYDYFDLLPLQSKNFTFSKDNADATLFIKIFNLRYQKPSIEVKNFPKQYRENYFSNDGEEKINIVSYIENNYKKATSLSFGVEYTLISNFTNEVIFTQTKKINKNYSVSWKNYYITSFKINNDRIIPEDENEKEVPEKDEIFEEALNELRSLIASEFNKLPSL